jgi:hypothetical protein
MRSQADLVAIYFCQVRSGVSVSFHAHLSAAVSCDFRDRPLHGVDRRVSTQGFFRLNKGFDIFLRLLFTVSLFWFGAFASAGGTAIAKLQPSTPSP